MKRIYVLILVLLSLSIMVAADAYAKDNQNELRIGVSPDYPPVIFRQNETITGIEAEPGIKTRDSIEAAYPLCDPEQGRRNSGTFRW